MSIYLCVRERGRNKNGVTRTSLNDVDPIVAALLARRKRSLVELFRMLKASIVAGGVVVVRACGEALSAEVVDVSDAHETAAAPSWHKFSSLLEAPQHERTHA